MFTSSLPPRVPLCIASSIGTWWSTNRKPVSAPTTRDSLWGLTDGALAHDIEAILAPRRHRTILTHGPRGEYGHRQHVAVHRRVVAAHRRLRLEAPLWGFAADPPTGGAGPTPHKARALGRYTSQRRTIGRLDRYIAGEAFRHPVRYSANRNFCSLVMGRRACVADPQGGFETSSAL